MTAKQKTKKSSPGMSETARTIYLFVLLVIGIAFIIWAEGQYEANFVESF